MTCGCVFLGRGDRTWGCWLAHAEIRKGRGGPSVTLLCVGADEIILRRGRGQGISFSSKKTEARGEKGRGSKGTNKTQLLRPSCPLRLSNFIKRN